MTEQEPRLGKRTPATKTIEPKRPEPRTARDFPEPPDYEPTDEPVSMYPPEQDEAVRLREALWEIFDEVRPLESGDIERLVALATPPPAAPWHRYEGDHDCWAAGCDVQTPPPAAPALDVEALLFDLATGGVAFEVPGKYIEVQHDPGTWQRAQEWLLARLTGQQEDGDG